MIIGIGVDLCRISRIENAMKSEHFRKEIFSPEEISYAESKGKMKFHSYASCYAAREAFVKASGISLAKIAFDGNFSLIRENNGSPKVKLTGELAEFYEGKNIFVSLTHEGEYACAVIIIEEKN